MTLFRLFFATFLVLSQLQAVSAQEDFIAPAKFSFSVQPGQTLQHQIIYKSGIGGVYDVSARQFHYDATGHKVFLEAPLLSVEFLNAEVKLQPGEESIIPFEIFIPADFSPQDLYLAVFVRRRADEIRTFELGSLVFLRIGGFRDFAGKVSKVQLQRKSARALDTDRSFDAISFVVENTSGRYFSLTSSVDLYGLDGSLIRTLENPSVSVFPEFPKTIFFSNPSDEVATVTLSKAVLRVFAEDGVVFHEEQISFPGGEVFLAQQAAESPFQVRSLQSSLSSPEGNWKSLLKSPLFQVFALVIVLTFVGISFLIRGK